MDRSVVRWGAVVAGLFAAFGCRADVEGLIAAQAKTGARWEFKYDQPDARPILFGGESRSVGVSAENYCLYADVWHADGSVKWALCANFSQGTHGWQRVACAYVPKQPVTRFVLHALVRNKGAGAAPAKGTAEFRNVFLVRREGRDDDLSETRFLNRPHAEGVEVERIVFRGTNVVTSWSHEEERPDEGPRSTVPSGQSRVWTADSMQRVFPLTFPAADADCGVEFELARNECESAQILVSTAADTDWREGTLELGTLRTAEGRALRGTFKWERVGYVPIEPPFDVHPEFPSPICKWVPDPLLPAAPFRVPKGATQALWLTVRAEADAEPGAYAGEVRVLRDGAAFATVPVKVTVRDFTLPKRFGLKTAFSVMDCHTLRRYPDRYDEMRRQSHDILLDHRLNPDDITRTSPPLIEDLLHARDRGMNSFNILNIVPPPKKATDWVLLAKPSDLFTDAFYESFTNRVVPYVAELRRHGLDDMAYLYGFDERTSEYYAGIDKMWRRLRQDVPGIPLMTTAKMYADMTEGKTNLPCLVTTDRYCPCSYRWDEKLNGRLRAAGKEVWWYTCCSPRYPYANMASYVNPPVEGRLLLGFMTHWAKADGFLFWMVNPWGNPNRKSLNERETYFPEWHTKGNPAARCPGDGHFLYPGLNGVLPSIRLANIRDGEEDYEWVLLAERAGRADAVEAAERSLIRSLTDFAREPGLLREARRRLGEVLAPTEDELVLRVRKDHPRLFFNAETWKGIRVRTETTESGRAALADLIRLVDSYPTNPVCANTGPVKVRSVEDVIEEVVEWGEEASRCALAWRFTRKPEHLAKAKEMLRVSIAAYNEAISNLRAVKWFANSRLLALCAYDWIYEALTEDERRALIVPLMHHVEEVQPRPGRPWIQRRCCGGVGSGFYGVRGLLWYAGLAALGDGFCDDLARRHLAEGYDLCRQMVEFRAKSAGDDGGLAHGTPEYVAAAYPWAHFNFFHTYWSALGENIAVRYPALGLFPNWLWWHRIEREGHPTRPFEYGFGDGQHQGNLMPLEHLYEHVTQYMHFFRDADPDAARLAATLRDRAPNRNLAATWPMYPFILPAEGGARPFTDEEIAARRIGARHFEEVGQFVLRSGNRPGDTYCLYTAGSGTETHKHRDEGNFVIFKNDFLALDSGSRGLQTDFNLRYYYAQTVAHNCVLIRRPGERMPRHWGVESDEPAAKVNDGGQYEGKVAKVLAFETNADYSYVASDATAVYGEKCTECVRQFVHLQPDVFVVYDRVGSGEAAWRKSWLLHTQNEPVAAGRFVRAECGTGRMFCETVLPREAAVERIGGRGREFWSNGKNWDFDPAFLKEAAEQAKEEGCGPYFGNWRCEISPKAEAKDERFLHVITVGDPALGRPAETRLERKGDLDEATVALPGGRTAVVAFRRNGKVGGSVTVNGVTRPLAESVHRQTGVCGL